MLHHTHDRALHEVEFTQIFCSRTRPLWFLQQIKQRAKRKTAKICRKSVENWNCNLSGKCMAIAVCACFALCVLESYNEILTVFCACDVVRPPSFVTLFKIANVGRSACLSNLLSILPPITDLAWWCWWWWSFFWWFASETFSISSWIRNAVAIFLFFWFCSVAAGGSAVVVAFLFYCLCLSIYLSVCVEWANGGVLSVWWVLCRRCIHTNNSLTLCPFNAAAAADDCYGFFLFFFFSLLFDSKIYTNYIF